MIVLDLEDGVPIDQKRLARNNIKSLISHLDQKCYSKLAIRLNSLNSDDIHEDLTLLNQIPIRNLILTKLNKASCLQTIQKLLPQSKGRDDFKLMLTIETAQALINLSEIVQASSQTNALIVHTNFKHNTHEKHRAVFVVRR